MQENIYAPPEAALTATHADSVDAAFYVVAPTKFLTLYFFTFSLYGFYWHYRNWKQYKIAYDDSDPMPIMRAIFSIFFTHSLFTVIDMHIQARDRVFAWRPAVWATIAVVTLLVSRIIDRVTASGSMSELIEFVPLVLMAVYGLVLVKAQRAINVACNDPDGKSNRNFTLANCLWIFLGAAFLVLIVIGLFFIEETP